jgi:hypothetical protein
MPDETVSTTGTEGGETPVVSTEPAQRGSGNLIPSKAVGQIRKEAAERGRREVRQALDRDAKALGYRDHADMLEQVRQAKRGGKRQPEGQQTEGIKPDAAAKALQAEVAQLKEREQHLLRQLARSKRIAKRAVRAQRATEAEMTLRVAATKAGVRDVEYAVHKVKSMAAGFSEEQRLAFNEDEYFAKTLKKESPHLYQASSKPAGTTPETETPAPASKTPETVTVEKSKDEVVDAKTMTREQLAAYYKRMGLTDPSGQVGYFS